MQSVYAISDGLNAVKIGVAAEPLKRLAELQTAHARALRLIATFETEEAMGVERRAHAILGAKRLRGEWFAVTDDEATAAIGCALRGEGGGGVGYFRPIIELWPTRALLAADLGRPRVTVQQWWGRDAVPADAFLDIVDSARARGYAGVTAERLCEAARARARIDDDQAEAA